MHSSTTMRASAFVAEVGNLSSCQLSFRPYPCSYSCTILFVSISMSLFMSRSTFVSTSIVLARSPLFRALLLVIIPVCVVIVCLIVLAPAQVFVVICFCFDVLLVSCVHPLYAPGACVAFLFWDSSPRAHIIMKLQATHCPRRLN